MNPNLTAQTAAALLVARIRHHRPSTRSRHSHFLLSLGHNKTVIPATEAVLVDCPLCGWLGFYRVRQTRTEYEKCKTMVR